MNIKDRDIFRQFESLRTEKGLSAENAFVLAEKMRIDFFARIRMLRKVYDLSLGEAKKIAIISEEHARNSFRDANEIMEEYQNNLLKTLESCFETESLMKKKSDSEKRKFEASKIKTKDFEFSREQANER